MTCIRRSVSSSHQWSQCDLDCSGEETKGKLGQHLFSCHLLLFNIIVILATLIEDRSTLIFLPPPPLQHDCHNCRHLFKIGQHLFSCHLLLFNIIVIMIRLISTKGALRRPHMGPKHVSREKILSMVISFIFVQKSESRIRFQEIKIRP